MTPKNPAPAFATVATELERVQGILAKDSKTFDRDPAELQREAIAQENAKRRQRDVSDMKTLLRGPECRRILYRIIEESGAFAGSFVAGQSDTTAYNEGQRRVGMFLVGLADEAEPGICLQMARESRSDRKAAEERGRKILEG
jgi:hypothetical protein